MRHKPGAYTEVGGRQLPKAGIGAEAHAVTLEQTKAEGLRLLEAVVERGNMRLAYQRVVENKGAAGVDGVRVSEFKDWLKGNWPSVKAALLAGHYVPQPVRAVDISKSSGVVRTLGVPTVADRLIQQALLQILQPIFEPEFSESSYGFRPGRHAGQAVGAAQTYVRGGKRWVVELDLEKFFDRVNHDIVMSRLARKVKDERVLKLIRRFLEAGLMRDGLSAPRIEGTPQGGPLSPLLSNILLTDLDRELKGVAMPFAVTLTIATSMLAAKRRRGTRWRRSRAFLNRSSSSKSIATKAPVLGPGRGSFSAMVLRGIGRRRGRLPKRV